MGIVGIYQTGWLAGIDGLCIGRLAVARAVEGEKRESNLDANGEIYIHYCALIVK
jgi:hypothetical protein